MAKSGAPASELVFLQSVPNRLEVSKNNLLIYDRILLKNDKIKKYINSFPHAYGVVAGESLKTIEAFPKHIKKIQSLMPSLNRLDYSVIALGGGSVGDFAGFVASILQRGVGFIQMPSTWLAAIDSAHGGKNGLNVSGVKNQVGTFYYPQKIVLCKSVLMSQPKDLRVDAMGEFIKHALLSKQSWARLSNLDKCGIDKMLWEYLPQAIAVKYDVLKKDPFEKQGVRYSLNLGHTMGHVFEVVLSLSHGRSTGLGLLFALNWSLKKGLVSESFAQNWKDFILVRCELNLKKYVSNFSKDVSEKRLIQLLEKDKKIANRDSVNFVFLEGQGKPKIQRVKHKAILRELNRQGWL